MPPGILVAAAVLAGLLVLREASRQRSCDAYVPRGPVPQVQTRYQVVVAGPYLQSVTTALTRWGLKYGTFTQLEPLFQGATPGPAVGGPPVYTAEVTAPTAGWEAALRCLPGVLKVQLLPDTPRGDRWPW
jgi:hypothetical protein